MTLTDSLSPFPGWVADYARKESKIREVFHMLHAILLKSRISPPSHCHAMRGQRWPLSMILVSVMGGCPSQYPLVFSGDVGPGETTRRFGHCCLAAIRQTGWGPS